MNSGYGPGHPAWEEAVDRALESWRIVREDESTVLVREPIPKVMNGYRELPVTARIVEAEACTGSRYVVQTTPLGDIGMGITGGRVLVTVLWPWQDCWPMDGIGEVHSTYVAEHLTEGRASGPHHTQRLHGGDLAALTKTVAVALGRESVIDR